MCRQDKDAMINVDGPRTFTTPTNQADMHWSVQKL